MQGRKALFFVTNKQEFILPEIAKWKTSFPNVAVISLM